ncbi:MAG: DHHW family protein [Oscillospiraceae bacterium]|nr:DHHW family protein [Oscillospiraceae bacterium]
MEKNGEKPGFGPILTSAAFTLLIGGAFFLNLFMPKAEVLQSERRKPAAFPKLSADNLLSSEFMDGFAGYASDNFAFREQLRTVRAFCVFDVFLQTDKSGLYKDLAVGAGKFEKIDETSMRKAAEKIKKLCALFPDLDVYYSFVPDKSAYASKYYPGFDPKTAASVLAETLGEIVFIDLSGALSADVFYKTDLHWDQSKIIEAAKTLALAMGFSDRLETGFEKNIAGNFNGAYTGQLALPQPPDEMAYLTNETLEKATAKYFDPAQNGWETGAIYDVQAAIGRDPYDLFLKGAKPLITIENPSAKTSRQLYLFRDSFGSSLAPLLVSAYAKITLIDMRYIDSRLLEEYVGFAEENADVLFLYSSQILNNSEILLININ